MEQNLEELRAQIDAIDQEMVKLFRQRMEVCGEVAEYKRSAGIPVLAADREQALLTKVAEQAGEDLAEYAVAVYRTILSASRAYQNACLGRCSEDL